MQQLVLILHVLAALAMISLVLVQHGKGADVGASFGSGAANTMFGSVGPASFLMKLTAILGAVFFATSIGLAYLGSSNKPQTMQFNTPSPTTQPLLNQTQPLKTTTPKSESSPQSDSGTSFTPTQTAPTTPSNKK